MLFSVRDSTAPRPGRIRDFRHGLFAPDVTEEVDDVRRALQARVVAAQDDAVPAGVAELDELPEKLQQSVHDPVLSACWRLSLNTNLPQEGRI